MTVRRLGLWASVSLLAVALAVGLASVPAAAEQAPRYYIVADVVRGSRNATGPSCVQTNMFKLGEQVVWRVEVYDARTGQLLDDKARAEELGLKVQAEVEGVTTVPLELGPHPRQAPQVMFWAGAWEIPPVFRTGLFRWRVVVTDKEGNRAVFDPVGARRPEMPGSWLVIERR